MTKIIFAGVKPTMRKIGNDNFRGYFELIRPFTLLAPIIVSICIIIASFFYNNRSESLVHMLWTIILPASFSLAILNGASNVLNQITDLKTDKISKPYRPIPKGSVSIKEAKIITVLMYFTAFSLAFMINTTFVFLMVLLTFFTLTYSLKPRCKDRLFINQLWVGIPRGLLGILASWCVFGNPFTALPLTIGVIAMLYLIGGSITKDITDCEADKKTGTHTLINTYGIKRAALMVLPFMFFPFAFIPILIDCGILGIQFFILSFLTIPSLYIFYLMFKDSKKGRHLENTSSWALMYVTYFFFAFGFSVLTVYGSITI